MAARKHIGVPIGTPLPYQIPKRICGNCLGSGSIAIAVGDRQMLLICDACRGEGVV